MTDKKTEKSEQIDKKIDIPKSITNITTKDVKTKLTTGYIDFLQNVIGDTSTPIDLEIKINEPYYFIFFKNIKISLNVSSVVDSFGERFDPYGRIIVFYDSDEKRIEYKIHKTLLEPNNNILPIKQNTETEIEINNDDYTKKMIELNEKYSEIFEIDWIKKFIEFFVKQFFNESVCLNIGFFDENNKNSGFVLSNLIGKINLKNILSYKVDEKTFFIISIFPDQKAIKIENLEYIKEVEPKKKNRKFKKYNGLQNIKSVRIIKVKNDDQNVKNN